MSERTAAILFRYLLVLSIALAPMVPAFAAAKNSDGQQLAQAHVYHVGKLAPGDPVQPHSKHLNCNGQCCLACGMSIVDVSIPSDEIMPSRPVQTPTVHRLHPRPIVTVPDRPPRALS